MHTHYYKIPLPRPQAHSHSQALFNVAQLENQE